MKTDQILTNIFKALLAILLVTGMFTTLFAQDKKEPSKAKIKVVKIHDGDETVIDTLIMLTPGESLKEIIENMDLEIDFDKLGDIEAKLEGLEDKLGDIEMSLILTDSAMYQYQMMLVDGIEEKIEKTVSMYVYVTDPENGEGIDTKLEMLLDDDGITRVITGTECVKVEVEGEGGEKTITIKKLEGDGDCMKKEMRIVSGDTLKWVYMDVDTDAMENGEVQVVIEVQDDEGSIKQKTKIIMADVGKKEIEQFKSQGLDLEPTENSEESDIDRIVFYPNPGSGKFTLSFKSKSKKEVSVFIYDLNGREIYSEKVEGFDGEYYREIDISGEQSGTYILKITQGSEVITKKIMLE